MRKTLMTLVALTALVMTAGAETRDLEAQGRGTTEYEASQSALMNLARQLQVKVASVSGGSQVVSEGGGTMVHAASLVSDVLVSTDIALCGVRYHTVAPAARNDPWVVDAYMDFNISRPLYLRKVRDIAGTMDLLVRMDRSEWDTDRNELLYRELGALQNQYAMYCTVAGIVGIPSGSLPKPVISIVEIEAGLRDAAGRLDNLDRVARKLVADLAPSLAGKGTVYIAPVSGEVSRTLGAGLQGRILQSLIASGFVPVLDPTLAALRMDLQLAGQTGAAMVLTGQVTGTDGTVKGASTLNILPRATEGYADA